MLNGPRLSILTIIIFSPDKNRTFFKIRRVMSENKQTLFKSPDLSKLREVVIDHRTKIYIPLNADVEEAKNRYLSRNSSRRIKS